MKMISLIFVFITTTNSVTVKDVKEAYDENCCDMLGDCYVPLDNTNYLGSFVKSMHKQNGNCQKADDEDSGMVTCVDGLCVQDQVTYPHTFIFTHPTNSSARSDPVSSDGVTISSGIGPLDVSDFIGVMGPENTPHQFIHVKNRSSTLGQYIGLSSLTYDAVITAPSSPVECTVGKIPGMKKMWIKYHVASDLQIPTPDGTMVPFPVAIAAIMTTYSYVTIDIIDNTTILLQMKIEIIAC